MHHLSGKSNRVQFTLRSLLYAVAFCGVCLASWKLVGGDVLLEFQGLISSCIFVSLLVLLSWLFDDLLATLPYGAAVLTFPPLYALLTLCFFLFGEAIDQPLPKYVHTNWVAVGILQVLPILPVVGFALLLLMCVDRMLQDTVLPDTAYFPRCHVFQRIITHRQSRFDVVIGLVLIFGYYATTVVGVWEDKHIASTAWPPKRVFVTCHFLWGLLWLVDCRSRSNRGTIAAAVGFVALAAGLLVPFASTAVRG